ncbi:hypothetical protein ACFPH8_14825 [Bizionia hallyeonensis]|uniref:Apea-like HEPN domain-containing protein n=1 Tax=Bizionia hallyeonensis TaxID=1123757 RepID=A0ABW0C8Q4_9FLAO
MRKFIDPKGNYIFFIPNEWGYRNGMYEAKENDPDSFELYEKSVGCFQITCKSKTIGEIPNLIQTHKLKTQAVGTNNLEFSEKYVSSEKFDVYFWMAVVDDKFLMCKYIYDSDKKESKKVKTEIDKAKACLKTILVIEEQHKVEILASERFTKFMNSLVASIDLKNRAYKNGSSIELVVLLANQIDALLRLALILKKQIDNSTDEIDTTLIFQKETDRPIMEKKVYKMALDEGLITQPIHDKLFELYNQRNKVIHRYIITDLLTKDVMKVVYDYTIMEEKVGEVVKEYEQKQFQLKIGIYGTDIPPDHPIDEETKQKVIGAIKEKHADNRMNKDITFE